MENIFDKYSDFFIRNEYFNKYVKLCELNNITKKEKYKTQTHHIIPRSYFKIRNINIDNSKENLIELKHEDHILAHFYLCYCVKDEFIYSNEYAMFFMLRKFNIDFTHLDEEHVLSLSKEYSILYEDFCKRQSKMKLGNIPWNKGGNCYSDEQRERMRISQLGRKVSNETKQKMHNSSLGKNKGGCYINNGVKSIHINLDELDKYLSEGWVKGSIQIHKKTFLNTITITDGIHEKRITPDMLEYYEDIGWKRGRSKLSKSKVKASMSNKGKSSWNKGIKWTEEQKKNFVSPFKSRTCWVTNGIETHRVFPEDVDTYCNKGFWRGMK